MLTACDIHGVNHTVRSRDALAALFGRRDGRGCNHLWLSHGGTNDPCLAIALHGKDAYVHYFSGARQPGAYLVGSDGGLDGDVRITFWISETENFEAPPQSVVTVPRALEVASAFLESSERPRGFEWSEL